MSFDLDSWLEDMNEHVHRNWQTNRIAVGVGDLSLVFSECQKARKDLAAARADAERLASALDFNLRCSNLRCSEGCDCSARSALRAHRELVGKL